MPENKDDFYRLLVAQADALTSGEEDALACLANVSSLLFTSMAKVNWTGFYIVRGEQLVLGPFMGNPACVRIPLGRGVCGTAAADAETQLVDDVDAFPGHIACDAASRSEVVVPFIKVGKVLAVMDIDSPEANRFDEQDKAGLEALVRLLEERLDLSQLVY
ncbi:GAF domain-containing protein [Endozoicomonas sp. OPT23]|nr:GAF domain-containing protein [Endozoicomonas sp. OPT23]